VHPIFSITFSGARSPPKAGFRLLRPAVSVFVCRRFRSRAKRIGTLRISEAPAWIDKAINILRCALCAARCS
jgi:hypothetical protein